MKKTPDKLTQEHYNAIYNEISNLVDMIDNCEIQINDTKKFLTTLKIQFKNLRNTRDQLHEEYDIEYDYSLDKDDV